MTEKKTEPSYVLTDLGRTSWLIAKAQKESDYGNQKMAARLAQLAISYGIVALVDELRRLRRKLSRPTS